MTPKTGNVLSRLIGKIPVLLVVVAVGGIVATMAVALAPWHPAYADHNSTRIICPDPIEEGNTGSVGVRRSGYKVKWVFFATDHQYHTASSDDYEEYHGVKFESRSGENSVWAPVVTKEDAQPEHDETFEIGFWESGIWHHCVVTIDDDDAPEIVGVYIASSPVDQYAYRAGESIDITVDLDSKVEVEGTPLLSLYVGDGEDSWRGAAYHSGSGTRSLVFRYRVQRHDFDGDGLTVGASASNDDGTAAYGFVGNIYADGTDVPINYGQPGVTGDWRQKVDGRPYVQRVRITSSPPAGWEAYHANDVIEITLNFDTDAVVVGDVSVDVYLEYDPSRWDEVIRPAHYLRGSGSDRLVFGYTVRPGDTAANGVGLIMGTETTGFGGSGTIKAKGTDVERNPYYLGSGYQEDHKIDTTPPAVSSVSIVSRPSNGDAYDAGELISAEVTFSESVIFTGDPDLELDVGGVARQADIEIGSQGTYASTLTFHYEVQPDDTDVDGVGVGPNRLGLNGGGIYDSAGNAADLSHSAVAADPDQRVGGGSSH